jgi:pectin methylesterase-like acyl-CoA thioesterase
MSDKTSAPRPSRGGAGVILSGLAVGVVLGAPVAAEPSAAAEAAPADRVCSQPDVASESAATSIREQFQASFTAGAVTPPPTDLPAIICET